MKKKPVVHRLAHADVAHPAGLVLEAGLLGSRPAEQLHQQRARRR